MISVAMRDRLVAGFRRHVYAQEATRWKESDGKIGFVPFWHQADWQLASEGRTLLHKRSHHLSHRSVLVQKSDRTLVWMAAVARPVRATVLAELAAFKAGKSKGGAMWLTGFAAIPGGRVDLVGLEYDITIPEFEFLSETLLSSAGLSLPYHRYHNQPKSGRMLIELTNGMRFECKSWERKDTLRGKERDCYYYAEAYMLPGLEAFTSISQNLRRRQGYAAFTTTPDRPWVSIFHKHGHGDRPEWHCTCGVIGRTNPYTFSQHDYDRDDPDKGGLLTREKFEVYHHGRLGHFVGRVYNYQQGERLFTPDSHPELWKSTSESSAAPSANVDAASA